MKLYKVGAFVYQFADGEVPAGAVPYEPEKPKAKAKPNAKADKPKNKAAKPADK